MKRVLILQHEPFVSLGSIQEYLLDKNISFSVLQLFENPRFPEISLFQGLLILGGTMNIDQEMIYPWLKKEKLYIKEAIKQKKRILAICLGAQLIADVLGARVYKNRYDEIGWFPLILTKQREKSDPLRSIKEESFLFQSHSYAFDLPPAARHLASSAATPNQAFLIDDHVLALQFHPEVTYDSLDLLFRHSASQSFSGPFVQKFEVILQQKKYLSQTKSIMFSLLDEYFILK